MVVSNINLKAIYAPVAQGIEQRTSNPLAVGSIPTRRAIIIKMYAELKAPHYFYPSQICVFSSHLEENH